MLSRTAEPPLDCMESKPTAWTTNKWRQTDCLDNKQTDDSGCIADCSLALKVRVTLNASDRRDNGCIANYSPLLAMTLCCPTCPPNKQIGTNFSWMRGESTSSQKGLHRRQGHHRGSKLIKATPQELRILSKFLEGGDTPPCIRTSGGSPTPHDD